MVPPPRWSARNLDMGAHSISNLPYELAGLQRIRIPLINITQQLIESKDYLKFLFVDIFS
jgi:hypothetical protein